MAGEDRHSPQPADTALESVPSARRMLTSAGIVLGSLFLLLLSLGTSAFLTFSALERAQMDILSEQYDLVGREAATQIDAGLRFGRPLERFLGLEDILDGVRADPAVAAVRVSDAAGNLIGEQIDAPDAAFLEGLAAVAIAMAASEPGTRPPQAFSAVGQRHFITALRDRERAVAGYLVISIQLEDLAERLDQSVTGAFAAMMVISAVAAALLAVSAGRLRGAMARRRGSRWHWMLVPLVVLLSAQIAYSAFVLQIFRANLATATVTAAESVLDRAGADIARLLALGLTFERMPGLDAQLYSLLDLSGAVGRIAIEDQSGVTLQEATREDEVASGLARFMPVPLIEPARLELTRPDGSTAGSILAHVNRATIADGLLDQTITILTVAVTSAFFMIELFILMQIVLRRSVAGAAGTAPQPVREGPADNGPAHDAAAAMAGEPVHLIARPAMFAFVFSWALPLSFLPIKMRNLGDELLGLPADVVLALPISAEMGCALLMAIVAGQLADRVGWFTPFLGGLLLSAAGGIGAALAPDGASFVLARGVTGLGYGLAWMGLQALVIQHCPEERRGQALANLMAGILAGFIAGTAIGGIMAEQFGHDLVLMATGLLVFAPFLIALVTLRGFMSANVPGHPRAGRGADFAHWLGLLRSPEYVGVLLLSVVPFSIAQVGLLYFAVPLHLDRIGASPSDAGRILMVYGVIVILLGPMLSRLIDLSHLKAQIVVGGGLVGGFGLAILYADLGLAGIFLAAALLSLSSALIEPARAAFILQLKVVREVGLASALGLQRAADKLGQMVGPLLIAVTFSASEVVQRVAFLGIGFVVASLFLAALVILRGHGAKADRSSMGDQGGDLHE